MGVVYKARQKGLNRLVALKMILAGDHATAKDLTRFHTEAQAVAKVHHPNVIQIHQRGEADGRPFFALELAEGGSLADRLAGGPLPPEQAAALVETLARAMHHAHEQGILHRDLKPANVLLAPASGGGGLSLRAPQPPPEAGANPRPAAEPEVKWVPKITDFGLAKLLEGQQAAAAGAQATPSQAVLGTPNYMAPEQALGNHRLIGPASDVYSLGAILYEVLTGRPPFGGRTPVETIMQVVEQPPPPPSSLNPTVPVRLARVCLKCLEKEPAHRYASAADLADDLRRYREGKEVVGRGRSRAQRLWAAVRRHPLQAAGVLIAVLLLAALLGKEVYDRAFGRSAETDGSVPPCCRPSTDG
jgi:serine/threonine protein kinase